MSNKYNRKSVGSIDLSGKKSALTYPVLNHKPNVPRIEIQDIKSNN